MKSARSWPPSLASCASSCSFCAWGVTSLEKWATCVPALGLFLGCLGLHAEFVPAFLPCGFDAGVQQFFNFRARFRNLRAQVVQLQHGDRHGGAGILEGGGRLRVFVAERCGPQRVAFLRQRVHVSLLRLLLVLPSVNLFPSRPPSVRHIASSSCFLRHRSQPLAALPLLKGLSCGFQAVCLSGARLFTSR